MNIYFVAYYIDNYKKKISSPTASKLEEVLNFSTIILPSYRLPESTLHIIIPALQSLPAFCIITHGV